MTEACLPDQLTPCAPSDLYAALGGAWSRIMPTEPCSRASLLLLVAHWGLETGFGHFSHRWNIGNIKHLSGDGHDYVMVRLNEVKDGQVVWYDPPNPATWLRAYADLDGGCVDYLCRLRAEFRAAWPFVAGGDVAGFCHALKVSGYYTADEALYTAGVERCYRQLDAAIPDVETAVPDVEPHVDPTEPHV